MATASAVFPRQAFPAVSPAPEVDWLQVWIPRLIILWVGSRTLLWTAVAVWTLPNAPVDVLEMFHLGQEWQLGDAKHPPLTAWLAELARWLTPGSCLGVYLLSYNLLGFCQWCAFRLASEMTTPARAALAALCLDGLVYFTHRGSEFNHNITLMAAWAWAILACYLALRYERTRDWLNLGLAVGLGLLSKYALVFLLPCLLAFLLCDPRGWRAWRQPGLYLAAGVAGLLVAPHVWWVLHHQIPGLQWVRERSELGAGQYHPLLQSALLFLSQLARLLPLLLILAPLLRWRNWQPVKVNFELRFLLYLVVAPVLLHWLLPPMTGRNVRDTWTVQLWTYLGTLLVVLLPLRTEPSAWRRTLLVWSVVALGLLLGSCGFNLFSAELRGRPLRTQFPGQELARLVEQRWHAESPEPLRVVAGDNWLCGNVSYHGEDRARVLAVLELDHGVRHPRYSPHLPRAPEVLASHARNDQRLLQTGGLLLWNATYLGDEIPLVLRQRFPTATPRLPLVVSWPGGDNFEPTRIGLAVVRSAQVPGNTCPP